MPLQVPPLLRQLLRSQQYSRRHRSRRSFNSSALLLHKRLLPRVLLLLLLIYQQQQQQAPTSPHRLTSSGSTLQGVFRYPPASTTCGCSEVITPAGLSHPFIYHTPKHTLWMFGRAITPPGLSHPHIYHTPKRTLWLVGRAITPPGLSHPLGAAATSTLSPGLHKIPYPPQDTTPGDNIFKRSNVSPGVCYLV